MKYHNIVYCKHHATDKRAYLYELPLDKSAKAGDRLYVRDLRGEHFATAFCENWLCSENMTKTLCLANGGYFPPAQVIGTVDTITIQQEIIRPYEGELPF